MKEKIQNTFRQHFALKPMIVQYPGRVNIIAERTDYNEGFVLPAAIDKTVFVAIVKSEDDNIHLFAANFNEAIAIRIAAIKPSKSWQHIQEVYQISCSTHQLSARILLYQQS